MRIFTRSAIAGISLVLFIILISVFIFKCGPNDEISQKPEEIPEINWIIRFSAAGQHTTAYTEYSQDIPASSGETYDIGSVAVHPLQAGEPLVPIIPFGTLIYLEEPVQLHGHTYNKFFVNDTGDVDYRLWGESPYWFDLFVGLQNQYNTSVAQAWGVKSLNYYWYEDWR